MKQSIQAYYQAEVNLLEEATRQFSATHPQVASQLSLGAGSGNDPHIERLLEGCAYLQARIKQQIDLGVHQVSESLIRKLAPQYVTPYPSMTIVEYNESGNFLVEKQDIAAGQALYSNSVGEEQAVCEFSITQPLTIYPMQLQQSEVVCLDNTKTALRLSFKFNDGVIPQSMGIQELPLFLHGTTRVAEQWYFHLTRCVSRIILRQESGEEHCLGGQQHITGRARRAYDSLLPQGIYGVHGLAGLTDYFLFPESYWFVHLQLDTAVIQGQVFDVLLEFSQDMSGLHMVRNGVKLHCVPACNAFHVSCEPIHYQEACSQYPLVLNGNYPTSLEFLAVQKVSGVVTSTFDRMELLDFYRGLQQSAHDVFYRVSQQDTLSGQTKAYLTFSGTTPKEAHLSCDAWASNGHYPEQYLPVGALHLGNTRGSYSAFKATNVLRSSRYHDAVFHRENAAVILAVMQVNLNRLGEIDYLKQLLTLHDVSGQSSVLIQGIRTVHSYAFHRVVRGMVWRGVQFEVEMSDSSIAYFERLSLWGEVLYQLICGFSSVNTVVALTVRALPSGRYLEWGG